jgi:serine/threonine-protein kinase
MGAVYRGHDEQSDEDVAIKRLLNVRDAARLEIEARLLAQLDHPRVVKVRDHFADAQRHYVVMELVEGTDLARLLEERGRPGLPLGEAVEYARQACEALQYIHDQHVIHRDVKPQNLIARDGDTVLVDFGIARDLGHGETRTRGVIGTPPYMAPEVVGGGRASPRSDVYGVAATLWTLITGRAPLYGERRVLSDVVPHELPQLDEALSGALETIPERRIASAEAFAGALGAPLPPRGTSLAVGMESRDAPRSLVEGVVRTAAGVFDAASASVALRDPRTGELVYRAAWGAGAREIVGVRLAPGVGLAGAVIESGEGLAIPDCRSDPRFASRIATAVGYIPHTMLLVPLRREREPVGVLSILDRRDGCPYGAEDMVRAALFAELALTALAAEPPGGPVDTRVSSA